MVLFLNRRRIEGTGLYLGTETSLNLGLSRLETIHEAPSTFLSILL